MEKQMDAWRSVQLISPTNQWLRLRTVHPYRHHTSLPTNSYITRVILRTRFLPSEYKTTNCIPTLEEFKKQTQGASSTTTEIISDALSAAPSTNPQESSTNQTYRKERRKRFRNQRIVLGGSRPQNRILTTDPSMTAQLSNIINRKRSAESLTAEAADLDDVTQRHAPPRKRKRKTQIWSHININLSRCLAILSAWDRTMTRPRRSILGRYLNWLTLKFKV